MQILRVTYPRRQALRALDSSLHYSVPLASWAPSTDIHLVARHFATGTIQNKLIPDWGVADIDIVINCTKWRRIAAAEGICGGMVYMEAYNIVPVCRIPPNGAHRYVCVAGGSRFGAGL